MEFERWPTWLRWICFLPSIPVVAIIAYICIRFFLTNTLGSEEDLISYLAHRFAFNACTIYGCIYVSCEMIPKGKIILSSSFLGLIVLFIGFVAAASIYNPLEVPLWNLLYEGALTLLAGILGLLYTIFDAKEAKRKIITAPL